MSLEQSRVGNTKNSQENDDHQVTTLWELTQNAVVKMRIPGHICGHCGTSTEAIFTDIGMPL